MRGAKFASTLALLALAGCGAQQGKLEIRPLPTGLAQGDRPVSFRVAEARGELALGNVALALEGFRRALREEPASVDAALGMANCYVRMGRFDLSERYYETALAMAPRNAESLTELAASLDVQGKGDAAARVRSEIAVRAVAPIAAPLADQPVAVVASVPPAVEAPEVRLSAPVALTQLSTAAESVAAAIGLVAAPDVQPVAPAAVRRTIVAEASVGGPRLERTSLGEVVLITGGAPAWKSQTVHSTRVSTTIRFVPISRPETREAAVRLLNAARVNRLAARTRNYLAANGWQRVTIGDAASTRRKSLIVYPARQRAFAERLAAQFGFPLAPNNRVDLVTVYLGGDAPRRTGRSAA